MVADMLTRLRERKPLIHHITNWVTIYDCANMTRAFGALPVMAHAPEEVADMARLASALVLNIGTLTTELIESMKIAARAANEKGIPVVLDAVGVGATPFRDTAAHSLLDTVRIDIIKGNASEIARLVGENVVTKGVESADVAGDIAAMAMKLAAVHNAVVVVTGAEDIAADSKRAFIIKNGHPLMGAVVGTGCMATSVIASFAAVEPDYLRAAAAALICYGVAGDLAAQTAPGPGTFRERFFDEAYNLEPGVAENMMHVVER